MARTCTGTVFRLATPSVAGTGGMEAIAASGQGAALPAALLSEQDDSKTRLAIKRIAHAICLVLLNLMHHLETGLCIFIPFIFSFSRFFIHFHLMLNGR